MEEAGEILEAHLIAALSRHTQQLILIGDHKQLHPKLAVYDLERGSRKGFDLDVSLSERLVEERQQALAGGFMYLRDAEKVKAVNEQLLRSGVLCTLHTQRRMLPAIANLLRLES
jgi:superfamily I DNA and/or RNA helicase